MTCSVTILLSVESFRMFSVSLAAVTLNNHCCCHLQQPSWLPAIVRSRARALYRPKNSFRSHTLSPASTVTQFQITAFNVGGGASGELSGAVFIHEGCSTIWF
ncbi:hypothetical protein QL285_085044 [Trifolium repens]|nr:hypothetical protein QL285_085044 [Trifolium repens]